MSFYLDSRRVRFRKAGWGDVTAMHALDALLFPPHSSYDMDTFLNLMFDESVTMIVAQAGEEIAGFMIVSIGPEKEASALTIDIEPAFQKKGLGNRLMALAERLARFRKMEAMVLQVSTANTGAMRFYERRGYDRIRFMKGYYGGLEDGWEMEKKLTAGPGGRAAGQGQISLAP